MANNDYRLVLQASLDDASLAAQIKAVGEKNTLVLKAQLDQSGVDKFNAEIEKIKANAKEIGKISFSQDKMGKVNKAVITYTDNMNNARKATVTLGEDLKTVETITQNIGKDSQELAKAALNADKFLAKAQNMNQTPSVSAATAKAQEIKVAVSDGDIDKVRRLNSEFEVMKASLQTGRTGLDSWVVGMQNAIKQTIEYSLSIGLVYGAINQFKEAIQYVKDLNKELTNIQLVTGDTDAATAKLGMQYNDLAKEMGATTIEVSQGSLEYIRQGKTAEETATLLKNTMMMAKLGNMEAADATEKLTAVMNGFQYTAAQTGTVVDKMIGLDNNFATSVNEIATSMQYSSNSARQAGVDFDHLAAYITVISSTTRQSAETIGQALKTMFARFSDIKAGKIDEDGLGINNVESALARVNISLRDSRNEFKSVQEVIDELGQKWQELDPIEQANIAKAIAGVRQKEQFLVLMNNQVQIQKALNVEETASGQAKERYAIYLKSIEASQNRLTASWEKMVSSAATKDMITSFYDGATAVLDLVNALGGIPTILKVAIPLLIAFNLEWLTMKANAIGSMIMGAVTAFQSLATGLFVVNPAMAETAILEGGVATGLNAIATSEAAATLGLSLLILGLMELISRMKQLKESQDQVLETFKNTESDLRNTSSTYDEYVKKTREAAEAAGYFYDESGKMYHEGYHGAKVYVDGANMMSEAMWNAVHTGEAFDESIRATNRELQGSAGYTGEAEDAYVNLETELGRLQDKMSSLFGVMQKAKEGKFTYQDIDALSKAYPDYLNALSEENGKLQLNTDMIQQYAEAQAEKAIQDAKVAGATQQEIDVLQNYYDQLVRVGDENKNFTDTFDLMINNVGSKLSGDQLGAFSGLGSSLKQLNKEFQDGQITAQEYFSKVNEGLQSTDFSKMFQGNKDASEIFFSGLTLNATQALGQINAAFQNGDMLLTDYTSSLMELSKTFEYIGGIITNFGDMLGLSADQAAQLNSVVSSSLDGITSSVDQLNQMQETNIAVQQAMAAQAQGTLDTTSQAYSDMMMNIANAAASSGQSFVDMQGNALTSAQSIYQYLMGGTANFNAFANQTANKTGSTIQNLMQSIGKMIQAVGQQISNFKAEITMSPSVQWDTINVLGVNLPIPSNVKFTIGSNVNLSSIGNAIADFGSQLQSTQLIWDSSIYQIPAAMNQVTGNTGSATNAMNNLADATNKAASGAQKAADATKDLKSNIDDAKKSAIDSLKAQLKGYKDIIDARKKMLDSMEKERDYQQEVENKNNDILKIQNELATLQFDTSDEANARKLQLQDELKKAQQELENTQYRHSVDVQKDALDASYSAFENQINNAIAQVQNINATSMSDFAGQLAAILATISQPELKNAPIQPPKTAPIPTFDSGGIAGESSNGMKPNQIFARIMKGEVMSTPSQIDNFMKNTLPAIANSVSNSFGGIQVSMPINVNGTLDKTVLPDLENFGNQLIEKINKQMIQRGWNRRADLFQI